ncbi:sugar transferase [Zunongwangia sp. F260]|uniref:Sugar transferase n=1 Tax=Autumnicola lenta TaxID=3075593 RepID=A0ABU3CML6_9FLAO|nr:sugar transferase [Zunongwangia sp. F260]MDT0647597.1 sugar transferase [Zunongwangia sp. F260]
MYKTFFKPLLDFLLAFFGCVVLSPIFLLITITLFVSNKGNPFFFQTRPGKNARLFKIIKFKTMNDQRDVNGNLLPDSERLTGIGKFIRKTSLDEIPQLLNVLRLDMSLIGPRPLLPAYLKLYTEDQNQRHLVRPGITGLAQVKGRNLISWNKKFEYDVWYVKNVSFMLDVKIFWWTVLKVVKSEGVNMANMATTEPYNGKN